MNAFIAYILGVTALLALLTVYAGNRYRRGRGERERREDAEGLVTHWNLPRGWGR